MELAGRLERFRGRRGLAALGVLAQTSPRSQSLGLYVHVPFCTKRCYYCSFNTAPLENSAEMRRYVGAIRREIGLLANVSWASAVSLETVFFGGGTPSLLAAEDMAGVLDAARYGVPQVRRRLFIIGVRGAPTLKIASIFDLIERRSIPLLRQRA